MDLSVTIRALHKLFETYPPNLKRGTSKPRSSKNPPGSSILPAAVMSPNSTAGYTWFAVNEFKARVLDSTTLVGVLGFGGLGLEFGV